MIGKLIKDLEGSTLRLTKTTLTEVNGYEVGPFRLRLSVLKGRSWDGYIYATAEGLRKPDGFQRPVKRASISINYTGRRIGCKTFDEKTFAKILKAADAL